jgi:large subunit ribosomal protein L7Ae
LKKRLKVPPALNQFSQTLDKNQASNLFRLLSRYRPETSAAKTARLAKQAEAEEAKGSVQTGAKPKVIKFGLNHVTDLVESKRAKLVVIAHDVEPAELVVWLPALCRKFDVPFCIVKGKARLGHLVHLKNSAVVALTEVEKNDISKLDAIVSNVRAMYSEAPRKWGGGIMGVKANAVIRARAREAARDAK